MKIQLTADRNHFYNKKPKDFEIGKINNRLCAVNVKKTDLHSLAEMIGDKGMTWCPGVFNGKRKNDNFISAQIIGLDFDEGVGFDEILSRSEKYMLPILFAYETFSSINKSKFRVVLLLSEIIADKEMYNTVIRQLMIIFPECDKSCKDASRMFFGGKNLFYYNQDQPTLDTKTLSMNFEKYMSDRYGERHYREAISRMEKNGGKLSHSIILGNECDNFPPHQKNDIDKILYLN